MFLKICGLREPDNIEAVLKAAQPDYIGFIFYARSARHVGGKLPPYFARGLSGVKKVGVFVNETTAAIKDAVADYGLDLIQLHGQEPPEQAAALKEAGLGVIKVFAVGNGFDFAELSPYEGVADYFLFDTKGKQPGGNGVVFNWDLLRDYPSETPFFLSGGIGPDSGELLAAFSHPRLHALDVNSKFEQRPGLKDAAALEGFRESLQ
jgi:phosphoribosylanthranilate isomerase